MKLPARNLLLFRVKTLYFLSGFSCLWKRPLGAQTQKNMSSRPHRRMHPSIFQQLPRSSCVSDDVSSIASDVHDELARGVLCGPWLRFDCITADAETGDLGCFARFVAIWTR
jgi:hypothetical protein